MFKLIVLFCVLGASLMRGTARAQEFTGTYTVSTPHGLIEFTLIQTEADDLTGTLILPNGAAFQVHGAIVVDDEDGELSVEGTLAAPQERGEFMLESSAEDGDYYLLIVPHDDSGTPRPDLSAGYLVQRREAAESMDGVPAGLGSVADRALPSESVDPQADGALRDPRLVGLWATQIVMNSPGGSVSTQLFMEIRAEGVLIDRGSRAMGSFADAGLDTGHGGSGETVVWRTQQNVLFVSRHGSSWAPLARFEVSGDRLLLSYYDGDRTLWHRQ